MDYQTVAHEAIARALRFLERNWHRPINVSDLIKTSRMSRRGFLKAFEKHTGQNPGKELQRFRLEHAQQLLRLHPEYSLQAIASSCGYRSINSFCVAFRREVRISPRRFSEKNAGPRWNESARTNGRSTRSIRNKSATRF
jgi:transcriptional regulator GlxA family with amidase domain